MTPCAATASSNVSGWSPSAKVAVGDFEEAGALIAHDDRAEGGTEWELDVGARWTPTIAEPRAAHDDPHEVMTEVPMATRNHPRVVLMYAVIKSGCAIGHFSRMAETLSSAFRWRLTSVH